MTPEQARRQAAKVIAQLLDGVNPNEQKRRERAQKLTLAEAFGDYLASVTLRPDTVKAYTVAIERDLRDWKSRALTSITGQMVAARHRQLSKKSATSANRAMRVLRAVWNHARSFSEDEDGNPLLPEPPTRKLRRSWNREIRRTEHIAPGQLNPWFKAALALPETLKRGDGLLARDYLIFVLLTGLRRREATSLLWPDVDLQNRTIRVRHTKNHVPFTLPLPDYLADLLASRKELRCGDESRIFALEEPRRFVQRVRDDSGVKFTIHDLRRTFITVAESLDISAFAIKALVNHCSNAGTDVTAGYVQLTTERLRKPMQQIADFVLSHAGLRGAADIVAVDTWSHGT
jgi:integrase